MFTRLTKLLDLFEPTFKDTEAYKSVRSLTEAAVSSAQWLHRLFTRQNNTDAIDQVSWCPEMDDGVYCNLYVFCMSFLYITIKTLRNYEFGGGRGNPRILNYKSIKFGLIRCVVTVLFVSPSY